MSTCQIILLLSVKPSENSSYAINVHFFNEKANMTNRDNEILYIEISRLLKRPHNTVSFIRCYLLRGELDNRRRSAMP